MQKTPKSLRLHIALFGRTNVGKSSFLNLVAGLIHRAKWSPEVVWGLGPGEAEWYLTGVMLHDGVDVPIKTASDEEFEEGMRRERAAKEMTPAEGCDGDEDVPGSG